MPEQAEPVLNNSTPHWSERLQVFIAETARPLAIISTSWGATGAMLIVATKLDGDAAAAAIFIGACVGGVATLYGAKAWEQSQAGKHAATVEVAKVTAPGQGGV